MTPGGVRSERRSCRGRSRRGWSGRCAAEYRGSCRAAQRLARKGRCVPRSRPSGGRSARRGSPGARGSPRSAARAARQSGPPTPRAAAAASDASGLWRARRGSRDRSCPRRARRASRGRTTPRMSVATQSSLMFVSSSALCSRLASRWRSAICVLRYRVSCRSRGSAWAARSSPSTGRPRRADTATPHPTFGLAAGDLLDVAGVDEHQLEVVFEDCQTGFQYTPVASITTCVTRCAASQSRNANSPARSLRTPRDAARARRRRAGTRTHAVTCALWTSSAAGRSTMSPSRPPR